MNPRVVTVVTLILAAGALVCTILAAIRYGDILPGLTGPVHDLQVSRFRSMAIAAVVLAVASVPGFVWLRRRAVRSAQQGGSDRP